MNKIREKFLWGEVIIKMYLCVILLLFSNRLYFLIKNKGYIKESIELGTYLHGFYIGWIYDNAVASYILILIILAYPLYKVISLFKVGKKAKYISSDMRLPRVLSPFYLPEPPSSSTTKTKALPRKTSSYRTK